MTKLFFLPLAAIILAFSSCSSDTDIEQTSETFIFGVNYGFCVGDCTHLFSLTGDAVTRDQMERLDIENLIFSDEVESELTPVAKRIRDALPQVLIDNKEERYGCPDCADQGTLFIQLTTETETRNWYLDPRPDGDWPKELTDFVSLLNEELNDIVIF